jgi:hypothetical protein
MRLAGFLSSPRGLAGNRKSFNKKSRIFSTHQPKKSADPRFSLEKVSGRSLAREKQDRRQCPV